MAEPCRARRQLAACPRRLPGFPHEGSLPTPIGVRTGVLEQRLGAGSTNEQRREPASANGRYWAQLPLAGQPAVPVGPPATAFVTVLPHSRAVVPFAKRVI